MFSRPTDAVARFSAILIRGVLFVVLVLVARRWARTPYRAACLPAGAWRAGKRATDVLAWARRWAPGYGGRDWAVSGDIPDFISCRL